MTELVALDEALGVQAGALEQAFAAAVARSSERPSAFDGPETLRCLVAAQAAHDALLEYIIIRMRSSGRHSWAQIGQYLGVSRQAAHQRFGYLEAGHSVSSGK